MLVTLLIIVGLLILYGPWLFAAGTTLVLLFKGRWIESAILIVYLACFADYLFNQVGCSLAPHDYAGQNACARIPAVTIQMWLGLGVAMLLLTAVAYVRKRRSRERHNKYSSPSI